MRPIFCGLIALIVVMGPTRAWVAPLPTDQALAERSLGQADAPVTIIEYSSLSCPHCADFHRETLAEIKTTYIDPGKVRYVLRDFPLEPRAMAAAMTARCVDPARYFAFIDLLFKDQQTWAKSKDLLNELQVRAQLAGLSAADFNACLNDHELMQGIQRRAEDGQKQYGIDSTPTFIINGKKISGARGFSEFQAEIDAALAKKS